MVVVYRYHWAISFLPLALVLTGRFVYKEKLSILQKIAVALVAFGVGHELWRLGSIAWETVSVAVGYCLYFFMIRKKIQTDNLGGFCDILLCIPVAIYFIQASGDSITQVIDTPILLLVIAGLGLLSALVWGVIFLRVVIYPWFYLVY